MQRDLQVTGILPDNHIILLEYTNGGIAQSNLTFILQHASEHSPPTLVPVPGTNNQNFFPNVSLSFITLELHTVICNVCDGHKEVRYKEMFLIKS